MLFEVSPQHIESNNCPHTEVRCVVIRQGPSYRTRRPGVRSLSECTSICPACHCFFSELGGYNSVFYVQVIY